MTLMLTIAMCVVECTDVGVLDDDEDSCLSSLGAVVAVPNMQATG